MFFFFGKGGRELDSDVPVTSKRHANADFLPSCKIIRLAWLPQDLLRKKEEERKG